MKKFSYTKKIQLVVVSLFMLSVSTVVAQENKLSADISADIVSSNVWRGGKLAGASIQPSLSVSYGSFSLGAWGSTELTNNEFSANYKEVDFTASYTIANLGIAVTDYWWDGEFSKNYFGRTGGHASHSLEASLTYTLPESFPLSINWNTFFLGQYDKDSAGDATYSTYIELAYPFSVAGVDMGASVGFTPWESQVYATDGFKFTSVQLSASKEIKFSDSFSLPVFGSVIASPYYDDIHFVFGITIK